jgi:desulfoferrodoxin (superoxide reductase-like protein)
VAELVARLAISFPVDDAPSADEIAESVLKAAVAALEAKGPIYTAAVPGEFNAAKHVPVVEVSADGSACTVTVPHGMAADHWIEYVWAKDSASGQVVAGAQLGPEDAPRLTFAVPQGGGAITGFQACNLHGVWSS